MYLSVGVDSMDFGFKHPEINEICSDDVEISDAIYRRFFYEQTEGKEFKIKNKYGDTFEEIFEEINNI